MTCDNCGGDGYVHNEQLDEMLPDTQLQNSKPGEFYDSCDECDSTCSLCNGTGFREVNEYAKNVTDGGDSAARFCPACWSWSKCTVCYGQGDYEDGYYDPDLGHMVGGMFDCNVCGGIGYTLNSWDGDGTAPSEKVSLTGTGHLFTF